ncbi:MAG: hypothetical protein AB8F74_12505 [Saprospiraceae bacterium]
MGTKTKAHINLFFLFYFISSLANGQEINNDIPYHQFGIKKVTEYLFLFDNKQNVVDSIEVKETRINDNGKIAKVLSKNTSEYLDIYDYIYNRDSTLKEIKAYSTDKNKTLASKKFVYDQRGLIKTEKPNVDGKNIGRTKRVYDTKGRIRQETIIHYPPRGYRVTLSYIYNENGKVQRVVSSDKNYEIIEYEYDDDNQSVYTHLIDKNDEKVLIQKKEFNDLNKIEKEKNYCQFLLRIPDTTKIIVAKKGDIWITKYYYDNNGLLKTVKHWLNNTFVGMRTLEYES